MNRRPLALGAARPLNGSGTSSALAVPPSHLVTHAVVTGMTGSGKTGLLTVMVEEALLSGVSVLVVDVKGDLANIGLACDSLEPEAIAPWIDSSLLSADTAQERSALATAIASARQKGLARWSLDATNVQGFSRAHTLRVLTPGSTIAEPIDLLYALRASDTRWKGPSLDGARTGLAAAISLLLRLLDRDSDPIRSREHVLLSVLAESRLRRGLDADLATLVHELPEPSITTVGAMDVDDFLSKNKRRELASALNAMLASPTFAAWREGSAIDPAQWLAKRPGAPALTIVSVAHLDDASRALVLGLLFEELHAWVRTQSGTSDLRALVVMDEVYGWVPPHPKDPPTKRPLVSLMKQGRAFGVGVVLATQNPMDLDYRALSNAGVWCIGRLQTDADRERVIEGLSESDAAGSLAARALGERVKGMQPRWFVLRDVHMGSSAVLLQPRHTLSWMKGPLTAEELSRRCRKG